MYMEQPQSEQDKRYERAKKRVAELRGFYGHLIVYIVVITLLFFIDLATGGNWWFYWPALGWGIGITLHGASVGLGGKFGAKWEEKKTREIMEKGEEK